MIEVNYFYIFLCAILSMVLGTIWYGFLFKKQWMEIIGVSGMSLDEQKKMQKESMPLYFIQLILVLIQVYIMAFYIKGFNMSGLVNALFIWLAFIMPTIAGSCMWTNDSKKIMVKRFLIQSGYQLMSFIIFGLLLSI